MTARVLLADDQPLVLGGLTMLLSAQPGMEVVGEAHDGSEAIALARQLRPDVVVMDVDMPRVDGVEATRQITADDFLPETDRTIRTLVITGLADDELVFSALRAGASGFLLKTTASAELPAAINRILAGDNYLDASVTRSVVADIVARPVPARPEPGILDRLTPREREILKLMAYGLTNADIAERLTVATATVKTHVSRVLMKLDVDDRTQAVVAAYQNRLVSAGEDGI